MLLRKKSFGQLQIAMLPFKHKFTRNSSTVINHLVTQKFFLLNLYLMFDRVRLYTQSRGGIEKRRIESLKAEGRSHTT